MKGRGASCTLTSPFTRLHFPRATKDYRGLLVTSIHLPLSSLRQISVDFQWLPHISCHLSIQSPRQAVGSHALLQRHFIKESTRHSNTTVILNSDGEIHFSWMVHPSPLFRIRFTESRSPMPSPLRLSTIGEPRVNGEHQMRFDFLGAVPSMIAYPLLRRRSGSRTSSSWRVSLLLRGGDRRRRRAAGELR